MDLLWNALRELKFEPTVASGAVWNDSDVDIPAHNSLAAEALKSGIDAAADLHESSPHGSVILGEEGSGKTHLVRQARTRLAKHNGFFLQFDVNVPKDFWQSMLDASRISLGKRSSNEKPQLQVLLDRLFDKYAVPNDHALRIRDHAPTPEAVAAVVDSVGRNHFDFDEACRDTLRTLCLLSSADQVHRDIADAWLSCTVERIQGERQPWRIHPKAPQPRETMLALMHVITLAGPILVSVDQVDALVGASQRNTSQAQTATDVTGRLADVGDSLMDLINKSRRTCVVVSCLPPSWDILRNAAQKSMSGRFHHPRHLDAHPIGEVAREIVAAHVSERLNGHGFVPPWSGWPVSPAAFAERPGMTPRQLLADVAQHADHCLELGEFRPMSAFDENGDPPGDDVQERFEQLYRELEEVPLVAPDEENEKFPAILAAAITAWGIETRNDVSVEVTPTTAKPGIHVTATHNGYRRVMRGLFHTNGNSIKARFDWLQAKADKSSRDGEAVMLCYSSWNETAALRQKLTTFEQSYGRIVAISHNDLRTCVALRALFEEQPTALNEWLAKARPASETKLLRQVFQEPDSTTD